MGSIYHPWSLGSLSDQLTETVCRNEAVWLLGEVRREAASAWCHHVGRLASPGLPSWREVAVTCQLGLPGQPTPASGARPDTEALHLPVTGGVDTEPSAPSQLHLYNPGFFSASSSSKVLARCILKSLLPWGFFRWAIRCLCGDLFITFSGHFFAISVSPMKHDFCAKWNSTNRLKSRKSDQVRYGTKFSKQNQTTPQIMMCCSEP